MTKKATQDPGFVQKIKDAWQNMIVRGLNVDHRPEVGRSRMYQGFSENEQIAAGQRNHKDRRRAANKVARRQRAVNRHR